MAVRAIKCDVVGPSDRIDSALARAADRRRVLLLAAILAAAALVRTWDIGSNPPGVFCDEAFIGWNANCLLRTGCNEYGAKFPLLLPALPRYDARSDGDGAFTDYRAPLFVYATMPAIAVLGMEPRATRVTSAVFGTLLVAAGYLLAAEWMGALGGLVVAALLAFTPWSVHVSRAGTEWITMAPLMTGAVYFFFRGLRFARWSLCSGALFGLAPYAYSPARLVCPAIMLGLALVYRRELWRGRGRAAAWCLSAGIVAAPLMLNLPSFATRYNDISVFNPTARAQVASGDAFDAGTAHLGPQWAKQWPYNSAWGLAAQEYFRCFSPTFLCLRGDRTARNSVPGFGVLYWFEGLLIIVGVIAMIVRRPRPQWMRFLLWWGLIWPLPSALTASPPHALRTLGALPLPQVLAAYGVLTLCAGLRHAKGMPRGSALLGVVLVLALMVHQVPQYFVALFRDFPVRYAEFYQSEARDAIRYAMSEIHGGRCKLMLVSPALPTIKTLVNYHTGRDPSDHLAGRPAAISVGRPTRMDGDTLLFWTPADFLRLPLTNEAHDRLSFQGSTARQWLHWRAQVLAPRRAEKIVHRDLNGHVDAFLIRADAAEEVWEKILTEFR